MCHPCPKEGFAGLADEMLKLLNLQTGQGPSATGNDKKLRICRDYLQDIFAVEYDNGSAFERGLQDLFGGLVGFEVKIAAAITAESDKLRTEVLGKMERLIEVVHEEGSGWVKDEIESFSIDDVDRVVAEAVRNNSKELGGMMTRLVGEALNKTQGNRDTKLTEIKNAIRGTVDGLSEQAGKMMDANSRAVREVAERLVDTVTNHTGHCEIFISRTITDLKEALEKGNEACLRHAGNERERTVDSLRNIVDAQGCKDRGERLEELLTSGEPMNCRCDLEGIEWPSTVCYFDVGRFTNGSIDIDDLDVKCPGMLRHDPDSIRREERRSCLYEALMWRDPGDGFVLYFFLAVTGWSTVWLGVTVVRLRARLRKLEISGRRKESKTDRLVKRFGQRRQRQPRRGGAVRENPEEKGGDDDEHVEMIVMEGKEKRETRPFRETKM